MIDLNTLTITEARKKLDAKEFSAVDLASAYLSEIEKKNGELNGRNKGTRKRSCWKNCHK